MRKQISCSFCRPHKCTEFEQEANAKISFEHDWALFNRSRFNLHLGQWNRRRQIPDEIDISRPPLHFAAKDSNRKNINQRELSLIAALIAPTFFLPSVYQ